MTPFLLYGRFNIRGQPATWPLFTTFYHLFFSLSITHAFYCQLLLIMAHYFWPLWLPSTVYSCWILSYTTATCCLHYTSLLSQPSAVNYSLILHSHTVICLRLSSAQQYQSKSIFTDNCLLLSSWLPLPLGCSASHCCQPKLPRKS